MNENGPKNFIEFVKEYSGAIIGGAIALLLILTKLSDFIISIVVILAGIILGNYIQKNKDKVKEILKEFIDKF